MPSRFLKLIAERTMTGDLRWSIAIMVDGRRIHKVIGVRSEGVTREQCERAIEAYRTRAREGRLNLPKGRKLFRTFREAADDYMQRLSATEGKNLTAKAQHFKNHLKPFFLESRLGSIGDLEISQYRRARTRKGVCSATINRELATLRHMMKAAVLWKWMDRDAMPNIIMLAEPQQPKVALNDIESTALIEGAASDQDPFAWLFVAFGLGAAMRHREILRVRYDEIDFKNRRIIIPKAKAGQREQPITQSLADALIRQRQTVNSTDSNGWVFPTANIKLSKSGHRTNMARQFSRAVTRAGLDVTKVTPHTMRRTAITRLVRAGVDLPTIQRISGHKTLAMVLRYVNMQSDHIDASIAVLDARLPGAPTQELH